MIFGSCHFLCHQFTQRDEPDQIIADIPNRDVTGLVNSCFSHFGCSPFFYFSGQKEPGHIEMHQQTSMEARLC